mmetsp:Transcript_47096/g.112951  ORF Transcript_47096/g.112951 Transcript_47096/m.112951 type:complete len:262 (+) Transcript_47096:1146-1931(+)
MFETVMVAGKSSGTNGTAYILAAVEAKYPTASVLGADKMLAGSTDPSVNTPRAYSPAARAVTLTYNRFKAHVGTTTESAALSPYVDDSVPGPNSGSPQLTNRSWSADAGFKYAKTGDCVPRMSTEYLNSSPAAELCHCVDSPASRRRNPSSLCASSSASGVSVTTTDSLKAVASPVLRTAANKVARAPPGPVQTTLSASTVRDPALPASNSPDTGTGPSTEPHVTVTEIGLSIGSTVNSTGKLPMRRPATANEAEPPASTV